LLFKGPGYFKKSFKKCGNAENLKAYRLIPPMTPLFNGWTIPLKVIHQQSAKHPYILEALPMDTAIDHLPKAEMLRNYMKVCF
jgi:hypothetical protein